MICVERQPIRAADRRRGGRHAIIPIGIYLLINQGRTSVHGWLAWPCPPDTALALGVLAVLGRDIPDRMRVFVLTVFVVDDLAALAVIAVAYSDRVTMTPLVVAAAAFALLLLAVRLRLERRMVSRRASASSCGGVTHQRRRPHRRGPWLSGCAAPAFTHRPGTSCKAATGLVREFREQPTPELAKVGPSRPQLDAVAKPRGCRPSSTRGPAT